MSLTKIAPKKRRAITAFLETGSTAEAAEAANVTQRTVQRWLQDPTFAQALAEAEAGELANTARLMAGNAVKAAGALVEVLEDTESSRKERIAAAKVFLTSLPNLRLLGSLEQKILDLEQGDYDNT